VIKQVIAAAPRDYTVAQNGLPKTKPSFWSRLFAPKPKASHEQEAAPKKVEVIPPKRMPTLAKAVLEVKKEAAPPLPKPNFLTGQTMAPEPKKTAAIAPAPAPVVPAKPAAVKAAPGDNFGVNLLSGEYAQAFAAQNQKSFFILPI